jgi:hypothetical protein
MSCNRSKGKRGREREREREREEGRIDIINYKSIANADLKLFHWAIRDVFSFTFPANEKRRDRYVRER